MKNNKQGAEVLAVQRDGTLSVNTSGRVRESSDGPDPGAKKRKQIRRRVPLKLLVGFHILPAVAGCSPNGLTSLLAGRTVD